MTDAFDNDDSTYPQATSHDDRRPSRQTFILIRNIFKPYNE